jgi:hypothetical protein
VIGVMSVGLAVVLLISGAAKLADRELSRRSIVSFGVPERGAAAFAWTLSAVELTIATALLFEPSRTAAAVAALALLALASAAVAVNLLRGRNPVCHCFGRLSRDPVGPSTLARNALLALIAGYVAADGAAPALFAGLAGIAGASWLALTLLRPRARRGDRAPAFSLADGVGDSWTLDRLLAAGRPVLLVFGQPACGACWALRGDLGEWHDRLGDRLTIALVDHATAAGRDATARSGAGYPELLDVAGATASAYGVTATPSAALIEPGGRIASAVARGAAEIGALVTERFEPDDPTRLQRRAVIVRAARGVGVLGAFPLLAAACGSSGSSSSAASSTSSTATTATRPKALLVEKTWICQQRYALCTNAPCKPSQHDPNIVICDCVVKEGYSVGFKHCPDRAPHGTTLYSDFSTALVTGEVRSLSCPAHVAWANCVDSICELDPNDASKATCQCPLVKQGPSATFGGDCNTGTCGKTVWSGAHTNLGSSAVAAAMKRLGQPLANLRPCPKA